jgi:hypothetical protein
VLAGAVVGGAGGGSLPRCGDGNDQADQEEDVQLSDLRAPLAGVGCEMR